MCTTTLPCIIIPLFFLLFYFNDYSFVDTEALAQHWCAGLLLEQALDGTGGFGDLSNIIVCLALLLLLPFLLS